MSSFPYTCALITGASSGIGRSLAEAVSRLGVTTVLVARSEKKLFELADRLGSHAIAVPLDVTSPVALDHIDAHLVQHGLQIDLLINNAGFGSYGFFHDASIERQLEMVDLNVKAVVRWTHHFLPTMIERRHGAIVNVSSTASFQPVPFMSTYGATKAFVTSFSQALASEVGDYGVRVIAACPGRTKTNFQLVAGSNVVRIRSRSASPDRVAQVILRALRSERRLVIEGWTNKWSVHLQRLFPRRFVTWVAYRIFKPSSVTKGVPHEYHTT